MNAQVKSVVRYQVGNLRKSSLLEKLTAYTRKFLYFFLFVETSSKKNIREETYYVKLFDVVLIMGNERFIEIICIALLSAVPGESSFST